MTASPATNGGNAAVEGGAPSDPPAPPAVEGGGLPASPAPPVVEGGGRPAGGSALERMGIDVIRGLAMDAPHAARSGHQGTAMALAPLAHVLWSRVMRYDSGAPEWPDRDRFILSAGHASILLYAMTYLCGYGLTLDDLKAFRQWGSRTPGHPEACQRLGVEVTTGPLGQGFANAVGMGIAERRLRARFGSELCDHHIFVICSDGDLAEGVSHEAASLAGHLGLGRLIFVYDDNRVSIDGTTDLWLSDDPAERFDAYGWHTERLGEVSEDLDAMEASLRGAMAVTEAPSLLILRSRIAHPSPDLTDAPAAHGYALGEAEIARTKEVMGLSPGESFHVPEEVEAFYSRAGRRGAAQRRAWQRRWEEAAASEAGFTAAFQARPCEGWEKDFPTPATGSLTATRASSSSVLGALASAAPGVLAGGADLTGNTGTLLAGAECLSREVADAPQIFYGVREHAMGSVMVGAALHGGVLPVGGTFLVFSDYMRPAIRLAALSEAKVVFCFSHDSVWVGEDGPTHQPVEHIASLRAIPNLVVLRPADAKETLGAWRQAVSASGPTALILTRQAVPELADTSTEGVLRGAYRLEEPLDARLTLVGSGSEVSLCVEAGRLLALEGVAAAVVSMPSWELFAAQTEEYRSEVIPPDIPSLAVEAAVSQGWERWTDAFLGVERFGASAPGSRVAREMGLTPEKAARRALELLARRDVERSWR